GSDLHHGLRVPGRRAAAAADHRAPRGSVTAPTRRTEGLLALAEEETCGPAASARSETHAEPAVGSNLPSLPAMSVVRVPQFNRIIFTVVSLIVLPFVPSPGGGRR